MSEVVTDGVRQLQQQCWQGAEDNGWHDSRPELGTEEHLNWLGNKTFLIASEAVEAHEELRSGKAPGVTYFGPIEEGKPYRKPEGYPSELADVVIRTMDIAEIEGIDLATAIAQKLTYNSTRGRMHGGRKF